MRNVAPLDLADLKPADSTRVAPSISLATAPVSTPPAAAPELVTPSARLAAVVGAKPLPWSDLVEAVLRYARGHGCCPILDNRVIVADTTLHHVFGRERILVADLELLCREHLRTATTAKAETTETPFCPNVVVPGRQQVHAPTPGARAYDGSQRIIVPGVPMSRIIGVGPILRSEGVERLWRHIIGNSLLDPADRHVVIADAKLRAVYGRDRIAVADLAAGFGATIKPELPELPPGGFRRMDRPTKKSRRDRVSLTASPAPYPTKRLHHGLS